MLVNSSSLLKKAMKEGYGVPAYNINNLEWTKYIIEECNKEQAPVILAVTEKAINYMGGYNVVYNLVTSLIKDLNIKIPVCLHLDHATSFDACKKAIESGFTSVMIDVSSKSFEENVQITKQVKELALTKNVSVEAELGSLNGEDDIINNLSYLANPEECKEFVSLTNIDSLAPSVGNKHGIYNKEENIDFELLGSISKEAKIPLVLHGGSDLDINKLRTAIFCGVAKININTDLQIAWSKAIREFLENNKEEYDPRKIISSGEKAIKNEIENKNIILGCKNKAF